ncbi:MAG: PorV/PorQ family protein [candidate division Zixibacteria bacterium]|nr:PorV/PorQ family protein [candidate division Zixibacteria bacterium]
MKRIVLIIALVFLLGLPALSFGQAKVGTSGAQFLKIGVSARAIGMGEAFLGVADDASALYYNPGGVATLERLEIMATHIEYPADIQYEFVGAVLPTPQFYGNIGLAAYWLHTGDMNVTNYEHPEGTGQTFSAGDLAVAATYSSSLTDHFALGLTVKYIHSFLELESSNGWAVDVGTYYNTGYRDFTICMMIANFGPDMKFIRETYPLPIDFRFGTAINLIERENSKLTWAVQASRPSDNLEKFNTGFEYWLNDMFALRMGKKFQNDFDNNGNLPQELENTTPFDDRETFDFTSGMTFGFGVKLPVSSLQLAIDYAYQDFGYLDSVNRFSFDIKF